jgi:hypothetical protein
MLTLFGNRRRFCDGTRRDFLTIGGLALGGLSLPQILRAESAAGMRGSHKAIIMIYLNGGPPHQDMVDLKPEAPAEVRGEFEPIHTSVPGIQISEHLPRIAAMMDKFAAIRSLVGSVGRHASKQCVTGRQELEPQGGWPAIGAVVSKLQGPAHPAVPPAIDLSMRMAHQPYNIPGPGFLGMSHAAFRPTGENQADAEGLANLKLHAEIGRTRLGDRRSLLAGLDRLRRHADTSGMMDGLDSFTEQAFNLLTSSRLVEALDLEREDPAVRARYGTDDPAAISPRLGELGYQALMSKFLLARRVVEAGARCVTVSFADFDWHGQNFKTGRKVLPLLDQGLTALVQDLHDRGLQNDVTVIVWGEFGRTPKINERAGRDHWPNVACALLAGGGMRTGQTIGSTNRLAEEAVDRPVHFQEVFATLYRNLGIDTASTTVTDLTGRPQYLVDGYQPLPELIG